jgi:hypothetical protein
MSISIPANDNEPNGDLLEVFIAVFAKQTGLCGNLFAKPTQNQADLERGDSNVIATSGYVASPETRREIVGHFRSRTRRRA